jgi:hypothetical protein
MDLLVELVKAIAAVGVIVVLTLLIPILFMFIFMIATGIDQRMDR